MNLSRRNIFTKLFAFFGFFSFGRASDAHLNNVDHVFFVPSFDMLRKSKPTQAGQIIYLKSWNSQSENHLSFYGGGSFISVNDDLEDDGGSVARFDINWSWKRIKDIEDINILDFGAIPDGKYNCLEAFLAMNNWSQNLSKGFFLPPPGVRFPAGSYYIPSVDLSKHNVEHFIIRGPTVTYGYHAQTIIYSDASDLPIFNICSRQVEISFIHFEGRYSLLKNKKPILDNTSVKGGTFVRLSNVWVHDFAGLCFSFNDTLDTKIDQFYANNCHGGVLHIGFDNEKHGNWNHSTAVEISNFNFQDCHPVAAISAPRCFQSLLINGWFERSNCGDFSNGHWYVQNLSVENCHSFGVLSFENTRLVEVATNQLAANIIRGYNQDTAWVKSFQPGQVLINNYGVQVDGFVSNTWSAPGQSIENKSSSPEWFRVGKLWLNSPGDTFVISLLGVNLSLLNDKSITDHNFNGCVNVFLLKQENLTLLGRITNNSLSPVLAAGISGLKNSSYEIFIKLAGNSKVGISCRTNVFTNESSQQLNWNHSLSSKVELSDIKNFNYI